MKIGIISDIHGNIIALKACISYMKSVPCDEYFFLGDYISDTPYTRETIDYVYDFCSKHNCIFLRGNREDYMLHHRENPNERWTYSSASGNLLYTYENLTKEDLDFYESLDIKGIYRKEGYPPFRYCHGSLTSSKELLLPDNENLESIMENLDVDLLISGHAHIQESRTYGNKKLIHPGSVGVPWYYNGKAQYMILHGEKSGWNEEFFQLDYDVETVKKEYETSGLNEKAPYWAKLTKHVLDTGDDYMSPCLELAMKLCKEKEGSVTWPDIPEKYWEIAVKQYGIL